MKSKTIIIPEMEDCAFKVQCLAEDARVRGNASAIDEETDKEIEDAIIAELDNGNRWAWCTVRVVCYYDAGLSGIEGSDYLGCCSYRDEADFVSPGGYYEDMKASAYDDFVKRIEAL